MGGYGGLNAGDGTGLGTGGGAGGLGDIGDLGAPMLGPMMRMGRRHGYSGVELAGMGHSASASRLKGE